MIPIQSIYIIRNAAPKRCPKTPQNNINNTQHNQKNTRNSDASKELQLQDMSEGAFEVPRLEISGDIAQLCYTLHCYTTVSFMCSASSTSAFSLREMTRIDADSEEIYRTNQESIQPALRCFENANFDQGLPYPFQAFTKSNSAK